MIVDDEILCIGLVNLCNCLMGMDSECDVSIEVCGDLKVVVVIYVFWNCLFGEYLDMFLEVVEVVIQEYGNL